jgi:hypothetical protein
MSTAAVLPAPAAPRPRSLWPHEHGAYGQLGLPLATALCLGRPTVAALGLTVAFLAAFVAHESLLVRVGIRGTKALRQDGARATRWLVSLGLVAAAGAALGAGLGGAEVRLALGVSALLGAGLVPVILSRRERSLGGELLAVTAMSSAGVPVALAAGASPGAAVTAAAVWALGHGALTVMIRGVIAHARSLPDAHLALRAVGVLWLFLGATAASVYGGVSCALVGGLVAPCGAAMALGVLRPAMRRIKVVGWSSMVAGVATLAVLVAALR